MTIKEAEARTDLTLLGVSSIREARALSWQALLDRWSSSMPAQGLQRTPVADGWVLPDSLDQMARQGRHRQVPCLIGYTSREGIPAAPNYQLWRELLEREYGPRQAGTFAALCGGEKGFANGGGVQGEGDTRDAGEPYGLGRVHTQQITYVGAIAKTHLTGLSAGIHHLAGTLV